MISWNARFTIATLLLAATALLLQARAADPFVPRRAPVALFPVELANWAGRDVPISTEMRRLLGPGEFLQRTYTDRAETYPDVDLYLGYLPSEHALYNHLPQDCLAGSGWTVEHSGITTLNLAGEAPFEANRYMISRGSERQLVLFWYWAHGRRVASEDRMNLYLILDNLRWNRSDNALIRVNTRLRQGETPQAAEQRLLSFAGLINPLLQNYIPR